MYEKCKIVKDIYIEIITTGHDISSQTRLSRPTVQKLFPASVELSLGDAGSVLLPVDILPKDIFSGYMVSLGSFPIIQKTL